jgi:hypothetical protein
MIPIHPKSFPVTKVRPAGDISASSDGERVRRAGVDDVSRQSADQSGCVGGEGWGSDAGLLHIPLPLRGVLVWHAHLASQRDRESADVDEQRARRHPRSVPRSRAQVRADPITTFN